MFPIAGESQTSLCFARHYKLCLTGRCCTVFTVGLVVTLVTSSALNFIYIIWLERFNNTDDTTKLGEENDTNLAINSPRGNYIHHNSIVREILT